MKLTKKLELGINAINILKKHEHPVTAEALALELGAPLNFLQQVMRDLRVEGIVTSSRGPGGGHALVKTETPVTAYQVAKAVGRDFGVFSLDDSNPTGRLNKAIADAFLSTLL